MVEISKQAQLEKWLVGQRREVAVVIAARTALRVLPLLAQVLEPSQGRAFLKRAAANIVLPVIRATALPLVATKYPTRGKELRAVAARAAARADRAAAAAVAAAAAAAARAAAAADVAYASAATAARAAAYAADAAIYVAISADVAELESGRGTVALASKPLWQGARPAWAVRNWQSLGDALVAIGDDWEVWIDWYEAVLEGRPTPGGEALDIYRVTLDNEKGWKKGAAHVNALIRKKEEEIAPRALGQDQISVAGQVPVAGTAISSTANLDPVTLKATGEVRWHYFLSYSTKDEVFARWVVNLIQAHGRSVFAQYKDIKPGNNFVREIMNGISYSLNFIALLSPDYEKSDHCLSEWSAAYNVDPSGSKRFIRPFKVRPVQLNRLAQQAVYVDLVGLDEAQAIAVVLHALDIQSRADASPPPWPKTETERSLVEAASPKPSITPTLQIDAGPNEAFDVATPSDDLASLPTRQRALIRTIVHDLPVNAPRPLRNALAEYSDELLVRGTQPILGLLNDLADIVEAGVKSKNAAAEWLEESMAKAFERFLANHEKFRQHFPLDEVRERTYSSVQIDEEAAQGHDLEEPFRRIVNAVEKAKDAGLPTENFVKVVHAFRDFAQVVASQPKEPERPVEVQGLPMQDGRQPDSERSVSRKKRLIVTAFGFFAGAIGLIASSAQLATTEWAALSASLQEAVAQLSKFVFF